MLIEIGRLTNDVEVRVVNIDGVDKRVLNNRLAVRVNADSSAFIDVTAWNGTADFIATHFRKGDELFIEGEMRNRTAKSDGKEFGNPFILVTRCRFTHGNHHADNGDTEL
jgi:single-stranded DNA-binding protein